MLSLPFKAKRLWAMQTVQTSKHYPFILFRQYTSCNFVLVIYLIGQSYLVFSASMMGRQVGREAGRQTDIQRDGQQYSQRELKEVLDAAKDVITGQFSRAYTRSRFFLTL